jgi:PAS domain S-box-containing protein
MKDKDRTKDQLIRELLNLRRRVSKLEAAILESEDKYRTIFEATGTAMVIIEEDTTISMVNTGFEKLSGFSKGEVENAKSWKEFVAEGYLEKMEGYHRWRRIDSSIVPMHYESRFIDKQGNPRDIFLTVAMIPGTQKSVVSLLDTTRLKETELELKRLNEGLEDRVLERTAQLESANKELERFAYSVSHDLRTPLMVIGGFSRLLAEKHSHQLDDKGQQFLNIIQANAQNMLQLIDDMLTFSRLGNQPMETSEIDIAELAQSLFEEFKRLTPERSLMLDLKRVPPLWGDRTMVRQVLANLLSNAVKFTRRNEKAVIEIGSMMRENQIVYYVKDNGVGFDMAQAGKLFEVFQRLHPKDEFEGTGIGLAIVRSIVQRHGGWVWAEAKINEGATFYFSLPHLNPKGSQD